MKTTTKLFFPVFLLLSSCTQLGMDSITPKETHSSLNKVTTTDLMNYFIRYKGIPATRSTDIRVEPITHGIDTVMYLVNYEDGWEVLSADRRVSRVLTKCDRGNTTVADLCANPAKMALWQSLKEGLSSGMHSSLFYNEPMEDSWEGPERHLDPFTRIYHKLDSTVIVSSTLDRCQNHLLLTKWGQGEPWNTSTPYINSMMETHCKTGCVPVAAAQILFYLHYFFGRSDAIYGDAICNAYIPDSNDHIYLSSSNISFSNYNSLNWDEMALSVDDVSGSTEKVAAFMSYLGYLYNACYMYEGTSASMALTDSVFPNNFSITCQSSSVDSLNLAMNLIDNQVYHNHLPIMMRLPFRNAALSDSTTTHHCVVLDGYAHYTNEVIYYYGDYETNGGPPAPGQTASWTWIIPGTEYPQYVAINWGWDGAYDSTTSGDTIWYNTSGPWIISQHYHYLLNEHIYLLYGFSNNL